MTLRIGICVCRIVLGAVFIAASYNKILDPEAFAVAIFRYQILPGVLINLAALALPWIELFAGVALIASPTFRDAASLIILVLLVVFTLAIGANILRGIDVACGCFTTDPAAAHTGWQKVAMNLGLVAMSVVVYISACREAPRRDEVPSG